MNEHNYLSLKEHFLFGQISGTSISIIHQSPLLGIGTPVDAAVAEKIISDKV